MQKKITDRFEIIPSKMARNRVIMPPMDTAMAVGGEANDFHIQHYGSRAYGGVGTIIVEATAVSPEGVITSRDLGLWSNRHIAPLAKVVKVVKKAGALIGIQLNHAGARAETTLTKYAPGVTHFPYLDQSNTKPVGPGDIARIGNDFIKAAERAKEAGFDFVEIHAAHGYFLNQLLHPELNEVDIREDMRERGKILIHIANQIQDMVKIPVGVRMSVHDHDIKGLTPADYEPMIKALELYVDYFSVSSSGAFGKMDMKKEIKLAGTKLFRIPLAKQVKSFVPNKNVFTVGNIETREDVDTILGHGIDAVAMGRSLLFNPYLVLNTLLATKEIDEELYHWNKNPWFTPRSYAEIIK